MSDYVVTCTSTCDLEKQMLDDYGIPYVCFKMIVDDSTYDDNFFADYPYEKFYDDIANGLMPTTSQVGYGPYLEMFEKILSSGKDVLHICLSSGISGDYSTAVMVAHELNEKYENKVTIIDSLGASSGYGMLTIMAYENMKRGMSYQDNIAFLESNKLKIHHWFISTDLSSYVRGGRISKTAGFFGSALKICPLMHMPSDGSLMPLEKIRTKTKAKQAMIDKMLEYADLGQDYEDRAWLSCSNCEADAEDVKKMIIENFPHIKEIRIFKVGMTIGAHTGPGTVALYFIGKSRD